jgi:NADPH2:quinone reductase
VTAGSDDKCKACEALGADRAINYKTQDFVAEVKALTEGKGVDVILDMVAGSYLARELSCIADDGRIVIIALLGGGKAEFPWRYPASTHYHHRFHAAPASGFIQGRHCAGAASERLAAAGIGRIKPVIHKVFPAAQAADAHRLMESSEHIGKIVLTW